jgi:putative glycosyltransferase (TIGR04372 family)
LIPILTNYFTRINRNTFDSLNWKRIRRDGFGPYFLGVLRTVIYCFIGFLVSVVLGPLSVFKSIEIWLMPLGPDKASHFIDGIEGHLRRAQIENVTNSIKIVIWPQKFPNEALAKMYRRIVYIVGPKQRLLAKVLPFVIWKVIVRNNSVNSRSIESQIVFNNGASSIRFSKEAFTDGKKLVSEIFGVEKQNFILFGYTSIEYRSLHDKIYHPKDDLFSAIPDPLNFVKVIEKLNREGIGVVRQGLNLNESTELSRAGLAIPNYKNFASGFPDIWLAANCKFLLSACTGSWWFGLPFNKPAVITDAFLPSSLSGLRDNLYIFQLPWNIDENRFESFAWMIANPRWCYNSDKLGVEYTNVRNSPEQIVDVVDEQIARLNTTWVETDEDVELQKRFQRLAWGKDADPVYSPRVGAKFLREYQHLLPD